MQTYYYVLASQRFLLEEEPLEEVLRERIRYYHEQETSFSRSQSNVRNQRKMSSTSSGGNFHQCSIYHLVETAIGICSNG